MYVVVLEGSDQLGHEPLRRLVADSLSRRRRFRSQLIDKPMGVGLPVWADIDDYDASTQVDNVTAPAPGGQRELANLVTQLGATALSDGSLWQAWTIDGLAENRWALAVAVSAVLGVTGICDLLLTHGPETLRDTRAEAGFGRAPSTVALLADAADEVVQGQLAGMRLVADVVSEAVSAVRRVSQVAVRPSMDSSAVPSMRGPVPETVFDAPLTRRRSLGLVTIGVDEVRSISAAFGCNTATVVLAALTLSLREWLLAHAYLPAEPLLIEVPLSTPAGDPADGRKALAMGHVRAPVQLEDPVQVLANLHTATERLNIANEAKPEMRLLRDDFASLLALLPPWTLRAAAAVRAELDSASGRRPRFGHCSVWFETVQPGYCGGSAMVGAFTGAALAEGRGLSVTVTSRDGAMDICASACPDTVPEIADFAAGISTALNVLGAAAAESPRGEGRSVVSEMTSHRNRRR